MMLKHNKRGPCKWFAGMLAAAGLLFAIPLAQPVYAAPDAGSADTTAVQTNYAGFSAVSDVKVNNVSVRNYGTFNVVYDKGAGTGSQNSLTNVKYGDPVSLVNTGFSNTGYSFDRWEAQWTDNSQSGQTKRFAASEKSTSFDHVLTQSSVTLTAQWKINQYTATFNGNGGTDGGTITRNYADALGDIPTSTRKGYTFQGWYTTKDGGVQVTPVTHMPAENPTYYAHWTKDTYNITFNNGVQDGSASTSVTNPNSVKTYQVDTDTITLKDPSRKGYDFIGWTGANGTTPQKGVTIPKGSTGDKTYTANWKIQTYNITYDMGGSDYESTKRTTWPSTYTIEDRVSINAPYGDAEGEKFVDHKMMYFGGWKCSWNSATANNVTFGTGETGDKKLTASWNADGFLVECYAVRADLRGHPGSEVSNRQIDYFKPGTTVTGENFPIASPTQYIYRNSTSVVASANGENRVYQIFDWEYGFIFRDVIGRDKNVNFNAHLVYLDSTTMQPIPESEVLADGYAVNITLNNVGGQVWPGSYNIKGYEKMNHAPSYVYIDRATLSATDGSQPINWPSEYDKSGNTYTWKPGFNVSEQNLGFSVTWDGDGYIYRRGWCQNNVFNPDSGRFDKHISYDESDSISKIHMTVNGKKVDYNGFEGMNFLKGSTVRIDSIDMKPGWVLNYVIIYATSDWFNGDADGHAHGIGQDYKVNAQFSIDVYTFENAYAVQFDQNGSTSHTMPNQRMGKENSDDRTLNKCTYTIPGMDFLGWSTDKNATKPEYTDGAKLPADFASAGQIKTLYAVWGHKKGNAKKSVFDANIPETEKHSSIWKD